MKVLVQLTILGALAAGVAPATTLELLGVDGLIDKSTLVVRGKVSDCAGAYRGSMIYTYCTVAVTETLKGTPSTQARFAVPGGRVGRVRQSISGSPDFQLGGEYVLFLWASPSGFTQILGLSQGKFEVRSAGAGQMATRDAVTDVTMLDGMGQEVQDEGVRMTLSALRQRMAQRLTRSMNQ